MIIKQMFDFVRQFEKDCGICRRQKEQYKMTDAAAPAERAMIMIIQNDMNLMEKLTILSDAAKYDAACTSSGVTRSNNQKGIGNATFCGICHSFAADGRCISLLKILMTNECIFDCRYCINRSSNDIVRTTFTPEEICTLTIEFYRRNYIEGLFLSSGIIQNPDYTMKLMLETVILLRTKYYFGGYIHIKGIPGASESLIQAAGWYVDRMSINLELATADALKQLAPHKSRKNILTPMRQIQKGILDNQLPDRLEYRGTGNELADTKDFLEEKFADAPAAYGIHSAQNLSPAPVRTRPQFVPAGQSTQMIIGATSESDYHIVTVAEALYKNYSLKRVFYSAFINVNQDSSLPLQENGKGVPLLREHRLYQADWLMRFYGFKSEELLSMERPNFNVLLDPKCDWALRHLEQFPVEINRAGYQMLLRVPGIGVKSAKRIVQARRMSPLDFADLKKLGVVMKRAIYFITCLGKMMYPVKIDQDYITNALISDDKRRLFDITHPQSYRQLSLFDDCSFHTERSTAL